LPLRLKPLRRSFSLNTHHLGDRPRRRHETEVYSEEELEGYLVDLKSQTNDLRLSLGSVARRISILRARAALTNTTHV
jgi:hypothetical protein